MKQPILLVALFVALAATAVAQQKQAPAEDKAKAAQERSERYKKVAPLFADLEQRKAVIHDLIDTWAKCRALDEAYIDAVGNAQKEKRLADQRDECYVLFEAKVDITPLETLAPMAQPVKGADLGMVKWRAIMAICDAYEYGAQQAKKPIDKP